MASMTLTEKILARHCGRDQVTPGENVWVDTDIFMTHDICGPAAIGVFHKNFGAKARVWDRSRVVIIPDHYIFTADDKARRNVATLRQFAAEQDLPYYYDVGTPRYKGVCHVALAEEGHTRPGEVMFGTDSHTCTAGAFGEFATGVGNTEGGFILGTGKLWLKVPPTMRFLFHGQLPPYLMAKDLILTIIGDIGGDGATYKAMEFDGEGIYALNLEERMTICNMAVEAGGKNGIIAPDQVTLGFVKAHNAGHKPFVADQSDPGARFCFEKTYDVAKLEPVVAQPHNPDNRAAVAAVKGTKLDRAYIGSCTGGKLTDFLAAARLLQGRSVRLDTFVVPATSAVAEGLKTTKVKGQTLEEIFQACGARVGPPSCAACLGGPNDTFGRLNGPLTCISTTNRNFPGRMGDPSSRVFLASPLTVAASALAGTIADPRDWLQ